MKEESKKRGLALSLDVVAFIVVILILMSVVLFISTRFLDSGKADKAYSDAANLGALVSQYKLEINKYPEKLDDLKEKVGQYGPWIAKINKDPWGHEYHYKHTDRAFVVYSDGANKNDDGSSAEDEEIKNGDIGFIGK